MLTTKLVRVGNEVRVGLRQGCVMSPWLFNLYIDGVVRGKH